MKNCSKKLTVLIALFATLSVAYGQNLSRDLQDMVGARGRDAEYAFESKGYVHIKTTKSGYDSYSSWWNPSKRKCVTSHLTDGRIQSIVDVPPFDCNKSSDGGHSSSYNSYHHDSQHHNNYSHYDNRDREVAFERGHNDGLHNKAYHNIYSESNMIEGYAEGYQSGVKQRSYNTNHHSGRGGYQKHARVDDLVGLPVDSAAERMGSRGFTEVNQFKHDGRTHRIYYNRETRQCIDVRAMHGKVGHVENSTRCNR